MAIRLSDNCENCDNLLSDNLCTVHGVKVGGHYTCDSFTMKASLAGNRNCTTCLRFEKEDCANPTKASESMLCSVWTPEMVFQ